MAADASADASPSLYFGDPASLVDLRGLTDAGAATRLIHECVAYQRALDARRSDLDLVEALSSRVRHLDAAHSRAESALDADDLAVAATAAREFLLDQVAASLSVSDAYSFSFPLPKDSQRGNLSFLFFP